VAFEELAGELVDHSAKGNFRALGKRFGKDTPAVAAAVAAADAATLATSLRDTGAATVVVAGAEVSVSPDEVIVTETPREGWAVMTAGGETVALDLTITPELRRAGLAREVVRLVQEARKNAGLEVTDRIELRWHAEGETASAVSEHEATIAEEVLAVRVERVAAETLASDGSNPAASDGRDDGLGLQFSLTRSAQ
jgi:isoleucyl-tRNA synthetase